MFKKTMINNICTKCVLSLINIYKYLISPLLGNNCRFLPTCSEYTKESIIKFGVVTGVCLGFKRVIKCHPWGKGGYDPVE